MKLWHRRLLLIISLLLFLIISPILVFYAVGYRFSFENKEIRLVGMIDVSALPKDASVYINDKFVNIGTPQTVKNLFPRQYEVKLQKEGYTTWGKKVFVESKKVTWIKNARLFFSEPRKEELTIKETDSLVKLPKEEQIIFFVNGGNDQGIWFYNLISKEENKLFPKSEEEKTKAGINNSQLFNFIDLSKNNEALLFSYLETENQPKKYAIVDLKKPREPIFLPQNQSTNLKKIVFGLNGENKINYLKDNTLFEFDVEKSIEKEIAKDVMDFELQNNSLLIAKSNQEKISFQKKKKESAFSFSDGDEIIFEIKKTGLKKITQNKENDIAILTDNGEVLVFSAQTKEIIPIAEGINNLEWGKKSRKLVFYNASEVFFYEIAKSEKEDYKQDYKSNVKNLVTRYSKEIKKAGLFPDEEWIYILFNDEIKIIELDERDRKNIYSPIQNTKITENIFFSEKGEVIYFNDPSNKKIYSVTIF